MSGRKIFLFMVIIFLPLTGLGQDHAWRLRHSGSIEGIGINPLNSKTIFARSWDYQTNDSLIVSYNRGVTWSNLALLPASYGGGILVHPVDTLIIFSISGAGLLRSSDYGRSWTTILSYAIETVIIDPVVPDNLFAGTNNGYIYRSTDRGVNWVNISQIDNSLLCDLAIRPDSTNILYAGTAGYGGELGKIWKSTDGGSTWRVTTVTTEPEVSHLAIDFFNPSVAYATVADGAQPGVWKTTDWGENWGQVLTGYHGWYVDIDRSSPAIIYAADFEGSPPIRSTNEGASWETLYQGFTSVVYSTGIRAHPLDADIAWFADHPGAPTGGVYQWARLVSMVEGKVVDETGDLVTNGFVELASTGERVLLDTSGGSFAFRYYEDDLGMTTAIHVEAFPYYVHDEPIEFIADSSITLTISLDTADVLITSSSGSGDFTQFYTDILDSLGLTFYFWDPGIQGVAPLSRAAEMRKNIAIYYTGNDAQSLPQAELDSLDEALQSGVHLFITGQNFVEANSSSDFVSLRLGVSHSGNTTLTECRGVTGDLLSDLLLTTSGGTGANNQTSRDILQVEDSLAISVIGYDSLGTEGTAAIRRAGTGDGGKVVLFGFGFEAISSLQIREEVMQAILGYLDSSIVLSVHENAPAELPSAYRLEQNYPNPFNPTTTIKYDLPTDSRVSLKLYDLLGREVVSLIEGVETAGHHQVMLDASNLSSGVYFYRLRGGNFTITRHLLLLR